MFDIIIKGLAICGGAFVAWSCLRQLQRIYDSNKDMSQTKGILILLFLVASVCALVLEIQSMA